MKSYLLLGLMLIASTVYLMRSGDDLNRETTKASSLQLGALNKYNIDTTQISVSGLSSGAFFANQFHVAHSANIMGSMIYAGGPYLCAQGQLTTATLSCMQSTMPVSVSTLVSKAKTLESGGKIDSLSNLSGKKVFIYSGSQDSVVVQAVAKAGEDFYRQQGAVIATKYDTPGEHAMPTNFFGNACAFRGTPYINNCNYNGAFAGLSHIYGNLNQPSTAVSNNLLQFDQSPYAQYGASMNNRGYLYIPTNCQNGNQCKLHVVFHGCTQTLEDINTQYVEQTGYNEIAEANDIIVLYPQAKKNTLYPSNPNGCWDWWGYTEGLVSTLQYATKEGLQIQAVWEMIQDLSGIN